MFAQRIKRTGMALGLFSGLSALFFLLNPTLGSAQDYPSKPIAIYVGTTPGAIAGVAAQTFAEIAKKYLPKPQPILLTYKPGASYAVAADFVLKQPADGYNLLWSTQDLAVKLAKDAHQLSFKKEDFIPIGTMGATPFLLAVNKTSSFKGLEDFLAYAKEHPGKLSYGSTGIGSGTHVSGEIFQMRCGVKLNHIPFAGGAPVTTALLGGHIDCCFLSISTLAPHLKPEGGLRALTLFDRERFPDLPDVPTCKEKGFEIECTGWYYLAAPKGTPQAALEILEKVFKKTVDDSQVREILLKVGSVPVNLGPEETEMRFNREFDLAREVFRKLGLVQ